VAITLSEAQTVSKVAQTLTPHMHWKINDKGIVFPFNSQLYLALLIQACTSKGKRALNLIYTVAFPLIYMAFFKLGLRHFHQVFIGNFAFTSFPICKNATVAFIFV